jgi:hypothetical protein
MTLPTFRYHPDPVASGSVVESTVRCRCCGQSRGYAYAGPVYSEETGLDDALCPWCLADGSASRRFDATFVDSEAFAEGVPAAAIAEIIERTPGYSAWQSERWPACCGDAAAFIGPAGITEIRAKYPDLEGELMSYIVYQLEISGGAARRLLESLDRDRGPTGYVFRCLSCGRHLGHIDRP